MPEFLYFYIDTWYEQPEFKLILDASTDEDSPFINGLLKTFANVKWVEENKIFVSMEWVDQAVFLYVSCPIEWAKENCPEMFDEENRKRIVPVEKALSEESGGVYFKPDSTEFGYYYIDNETGELKRLLEEDV